MKNPKLTIYCGENLPASVKPDIYDNCKVYQFPENYKHPLEQIRIAKNIARNINKHGQKVVLYTHSPYILSAFNNLIYAAQCVAKYPETKEKVYEIVPIEFHLDINDVVATYFGKTTQSMIDSELQLLDVEMIDTASKIINKQYDVLSDIYYTQQHGK